MRPTTSLHIPQPCHESWAAMSPTAAGRHCAACAKTVVDFTLATDAEILAYLARAVGGRPCGRFAAGQLERPLQRAAPVAPTARWRAWVAAAVAVWGLREGWSNTVKAQAATEWRARYWGGPVPDGPSAAQVTPALVVPKKTASSEVPPSYHEITQGLSVLQPYPDHLAQLPVKPLVLRGVITDFADNKGMPGVTVLIKGTQIGTNTDVNGNYALTIPTELATAPAFTVSVSSIGYVRQERTLTSGAAVAAQPFLMKADERELTGEIVIMYSKVPPAPWHPRAVYCWGQYWLGRAFRR